MRKVAVVLSLLLAGCVTTGMGTVDKVKLSEGYYTKGVAYLEVKNYEMALVEFQRAIQTDDKNKQAYYALGLVHDMQGKYKEAEAFYGEAIERDALFSEAYNALGVVQVKQQRWQEAIVNFKKALDNKLYNTPHLPWLNIGDVYMATRDYDKAIAAYRESKMYVNQDFIVIKLGQALLEGGKVKEAVKEFQEGVSLAPSSANMRYSLGVALLKDGNKNGAAAEFRKAAELAPGTEIARLANDYLKTLR